MEEEIKKITINKRNVNDFIYKLLNEGNLNKIIRHFKVIINKNCINNGHDPLYKENDLILSQNTENYENIYYPPVNNYNDIINDLRKIEFEEKHKSINEINEIIENHKNNVLNEYEEDMINSSFNEDEKSAIETHINNIGDNDIYIRCGIINEEDDKQYYLIKLFELYIASYFNDLSKETQQKILNESLLPMYNDNIFLSDNKYNFLTNIDVIKNILNQFNENID